MLKKIAPVVGLYPTPVAIIGAMVENQPTWTLIAHMGIIGYGYISAAIGKNHYINKGLLDKRAASIHMVREEMLKKADYIGRNSGYKTDKSSVFKYHLSDSELPIIDEAPVAMECSVIDIYETKDFHNYIFEVNHTYADQDILTERERIDYHKFSPVLFEMPTCNYVTTGKMLGRCMEVE